MAQSMSQQSPCAPSYIENVESLQGIVRSYVVRAGLAHGDAVQNVTFDVLNEAALQTLAHAELFSTVCQPRAWFLGIAANVIKRHRTAFYQIQGRRQTPPLRFS